MLAGSCTTKKNTVVTRSYHNLTAHYNVYFNANEVYKTVVKYEEITPEIEKNIKIAYQNCAEFYQSCGELELAQKCLKEYDEISKIIQSKKRGSGDKENN